MLSVSILTPSLNQGRFIEASIQSVLTQQVDGRALEYLVLDGGSSDGTLDILRHYDGRLRWVSEPDRGQAHAVNKGIDLARGDVIGWLNSDDIYYADAIRAACEFLETHPSVDVVYGDAEYIDENGLSIGRYPTEPFSSERLEQICFLCQPAVFFRRDVADQFGQLDERLHVALDYEYWLRLSRRGASFAHLPRVLAGWRLHPEIKSRRQRMRLHVEVNNMMRERLGYVPDQWIYNYAHARLEATSVDSSKHLRFAVSLAMFAIWASVRWNHGISTTVKATVIIWLKDGVKLLYWSMRAHARAWLVR
ncbi:MAG: glycosyltransferase [Chloroflexi bacterium]|nr:glycosyltransferase [Chloroflexota bacterium]